MDPWTADPLLKNMHFLIVDDDLTFLGVLEGMLRVMGIGNITRAQSGTEAFEVMSKPHRTLDVVFCDVDMVAGNGLQLLKSVRTGGVKFVRPNVCFLMLTSHAGPQFVTTAAHLDAHGYLVKPVTPAKLYGAVQKGRARHFPVNVGKYSFISLPEVAA